jgi:hypothetical protein
MEAVAYQQLAVVALAAQIDRPPTLAGRLSSAPEQLLEQPEAPGPVLLAMKTMAFPQIVMKQPAVEVVLLGDLLGNGFALEQSKWMLQMIRSALTVVPLALGYSQTKPWICMELWEKWTSRWLEKGSCQQVLKAFPDLKPGDMVLMKKETLAVINYRFERVQEVLLRYDRSVRSASIKYCTRTQMERLLINSKASPEVESHCLCLVKGLELRKFPLGEIVFLIFLS